MIRPEFSPEVLAQKAREALARIGYETRPRDEAYGFEWDREFVDYAKGKDAPPQWTRLLSERPSPLAFWYRRSDEALIGYAFHSDLLVPGIVDRGDPPPIQSGMINARFDYQGHLLFLEAIPPQRSETPTAPARR